MNLFKKSGIFLILTVLSLISCQNWNGRLIKEPKRKIQFQPELPRNLQLLREKPSAQDSDVFLNWLLGRSHLTHDYQTYDGWFNNKDKPNLGSIGSPLMRYTSAKYEDGKSKPASRDRPNPFHLSDFLSRINFTSKSVAGKNALLVFFGEHVTNEIVDTRQSSCPPEYFDISIPQNHEFSRMSGHTHFPFIRTKFDPKTGKSVTNPRKMINEVTPWIDGGTIYGRSKLVSDQLRSFRNGRLRQDETGFFPTKNSINLPIDNQPIHRENGTNLEPVSRLRSVGDSHANENPFLLAINIIWFRWHNILADKFKSIHPYWSDEKIFNAARRWVIATQQQIVVNEWLPIWTGERLEPYKRGYDQTMDPSISHLFAGAAMRYGHALVPSVISIWKSSCRSRRQNLPDLADGSFERQSIRLCNSYFKSINLTSVDFVNLIMGLTLTSAQSDGPTLSRDIQTRTYGPLDFTRRDLAAINTQRGRDFGLVDYISARKAFKLPIYTDINDIINNLWEGIKDQPSLFSKLRQLYQNPDDIDVWFGGLLESNKNGMGQLFKTIINEQFRRIRDSDYFWFQNRLNKIFTENQIERLETISIRDILMMTLDIDSASIQLRPFLLPDDQDNVLPDCAPSELFRFPCKSGSVCYELSSKFKLNEPCKGPETFDYFTRSGIPFLVTFASLGLFIIGCWIVLIVLVVQRKRTDEMIKMKSSRKNKKSMTLDEHTFMAFEWDGSEDDLKPILITFELNDKRIVIKSLGNNSKMIRRIDLRRVRTVTVMSSFNTKQHYIIIKFPNEHDLIIKFDSEDEKRRFSVKLDEFLASLGVGQDRRSMDYKRMLKGGYTKKQRQKLLELFFRAVFAHAFEIKPLKGKVDIKVAKDILRMELTEYEFAEALAMRPDSLFVKQMFALVDKDGNGYISFREFLDMMIIFAKGSADQKAKLMFDMYDLDGTGSLSKEEFSTMIRSMLELANQSIESTQMEELISSMFHSAGLNEKSELTLGDFLKFLGDYKEEFGYVELNLELGDLNKQIDAVSSNRRASAIYRAGDKVVRAYSIYSDEEKPADKGKEDASMNVEIYEPTSRGGPLSLLFRFIEERKWHIFWFGVLILILSYLFIDKFLFYTYFAEQRGLRRIAGPGVALARGSASALMFCFSILLLTMSRNVITFLRETFLHKFIPFDASVSFHKVVAIIGLIFASIHTIGHLSNFYHIVTQRPDDLACLFPSFTRRSHELPKFQNWCFTTITGITGVLLVALTAVIYIFATPTSRRYVFNAFWSTHALYPLFYLLMFLHGLGRLIQEPLLFRYLALPLVIFKIDQLISVSRKKIEIRVVRSALYPSNVTMLELAKPENFDFKSGQWVRIACKALNSNEYHPFTLASAPHEETLQLFIRAVGPFTTNIRRIYDPDSLRLSPYPKIYLDGPYGETHQDWFRYPVSVLVGGGIGVTPFASILKDVAFRASINRMTTCRKVYFLWVTRSQKHFEWLVDILRNLEEKDKSNLVSVQIFITQFYDKFDLRTMMLYVCERHFQRVSNRSLFTGLKAKTQFGRPNFVQFFGHLQRTYNKVDRIGVFSCGPSPMTTGVGSACATLNHRPGALFIHHSENF